MERPSTVRLSTDNWIAIVTLIVGQGLTVAYFVHRALVQIEVQQQVLVMHEKRIDKLEGRLEK